VLGMGAEAHNAPERGAVPPDTSTRPEVCSASVTLTTGPPSMMCELLEARPTPDADPRAPAVGRRARPATGPDRGRAGGASPSARHGADPSRHHEFAARLNPWHGAWPHRYSSDNTLPHRVPALRGPLTSPGDRTRRGSAHSRRAVEVSDRPSPRWSMRHRSAADPLLIHLPSIRQGALSRTPGGKRWASCARATADPHHHHHPRHHPQGADRQNPPAGSHNPGQAPTRQASLGGQRVGHSRPDQQCIIHPPAERKDDGARKDGWTVDRRSAALESPSVTAPRCFH
jgi:hypothetical protein